MSALCRQQGCLSWACWHTWSCHWADAWRPAHWKAWPLPSSMWQAVSSNSEVMVAASTWVASPSSRSSSGLSMHLSCAVFAQKVLSV